MTVKQLRELLQGIESRDPAYSQLPVTINGEPLYGGGEGAGLHYRFNDDGDEPTNIELLRDI
jgi:hypothetical protein